MKTQQEEKPAKSEILAEFLKFIQECENEYELAYEEVGREDRRLQDLLHEMEFAPDKLARNRTATKLHYSRVARRKNKDITTENEEIVTFFKNQKTLINGMKELLGRQRKKEEYLKGERIYRPRENEEATMPLKKKVIKVISNTTK